MATDIVDSNTIRYSRIIIYVDSQAVIKAVIKPGKQSGQQIIGDILDNTKRMRSQKPHSY